jgi:hypothetical protein
MACKFEIGDTVILNEDYGNCKKGDIGVIYGDDNDSRPGWIVYSVKMNNGKQIGCFGKRLKKYKEPKTKNEPLSLLDWDEKAGICGTPTNYHDVYGKPIYVGDVVDVVNMDRKNVICQSVMVEKKLLYRHNRKKIFASGCECVCNDETGELYGYLLIKVESYTKHKPGDKISDTKYV